MNIEDLATGSFDEPELDSEELFEAFVDAPYGVYCVDMDGSILFCNAAAVRLLEYEEDELLHKACSQVLGTALEGAGSYPHSGCGAVPWAMRGDIAPSNTCSVRTMSSRQKWITVTHMLLPADDPELSLIVHILYDISDQVEGKVLLQRLGSYLSGIGSDHAMENQSREPDPAINRPQLLTERETDVLHLLSQGKGTRDIADSLVISEATVRTHVQHLLEKLRSKNRLEAVAAARRMGLV